MLRIASAVIGGLGALVGGLFGLGLFVGGVALLAMGEATGAIDLELFFLSVGAGWVISCSAGVAGAVFAAVGTRLWAAGWLMTAGAVVYLFSSVVYTLVTIAWAPPDLPASAIFDPTSVSDYFGFLVPTPLPLLVGAILAFLAHRRARVPEAR